MITEVPVTPDHARQGTPTLHTADEAAAILRVKRSWLERQAAARKIPFTVLGGSYRFTTAHLAEIVRLYEQLPSQPVEAPSRSSATRGRRPTAAARVAPRQPTLLRPRPRHGPSQVA